MAIGEVIVVSTKHAGVVRLIRMVQMRIVFTLNELIYLPHIVAVGTPFDFHRVVKIMILSAAMKAADESLRQIVSDDIFW